MYFSKVFAVVAIALVANASAAPAVEAVPVPVPAVSEEIQFSARGFGCPNDYPCNEHCISLKGGRTGGYCAGFLWLVCTCIFGKN
ncbi:hypothetical protein P153DRAFT_380860 [Dothidotthia symphoricarpi CBS 119687]|uniref:Invertebrate defensins family profile domain-containing protein n=1 Tax=Dothidotthia symphoricarpi CBS 119687 TaxID=1392245 RepID=A0A6A6AP22_9PLEO|nr:uncharacterized protein P153DRAFT_380860 [Dothidotthia symphoricarpi CBS 119687]KAF2133669.1 hypothetical protein P153DRAFT_380860 [Dothidotthia symphoricarpi CBS 119687]